MSKLRVGMVGVSWWTDVVYPGFASAEHAEIAGIASRSEEKVAQFASKHSIPIATTDVQSLISSPEIDAIYVGVPNYLHEEIAIGALAAGKHVLQEKPMSLDISRAMAQKQIAESKGLTLMVNQELRLTPCLDGIRSIIDEKVGPLRKVSLSVSKAPDAWTGWRADPEKSGGTLFEIAIHQLDFARWLFQRDPVSTLAWGRDEPGQDMTVILDFGRGDSAVIDYCWRTIGFDMRLVCQGERGLIVQEIGMLTGKSKRTVHSADGDLVDGSPGEVFGNETFRRVMNGFALAAKTGGEPPISSLDGVWAVRMAEAARDSMRSGEPVSLSIM